MVPNDSLITPDLSSICRIGSTLCSRIALLALAMLQLAGCGVSRAMHQAAVDALAESQSEVVSMQQKLAESGDVVAAEMKARETETSRAARTEIHEVLVQGLAAEIEAGRVTVRERGDSIVVDLPQDLLFALGSQQLGEIGLETIRSLAVVLGPLDPWNFHVEVHAGLDEADEALDATSWRSTAIRAAAVVGQLVDSGVAPERLAATGLGNSRPRADNRSEKGRALNRRVEVVLVPVR